MGQLVYHSQNLSIPPLFIMMEKEAVWGKCKLSTDY